MLLMYVIHYNMRKKINYNSTYKILKVKTAFLQFEDSLCIFIFSYFCESFCVFFANGICAKVIITFHKQTELTLMLMKETVSIIYVVVPSKIIWINCVFWRLFSMPWDNVAFYFCFVKNTLFRIICNKKVHLNFFTNSKEGIW